MLDFCAEHDVRPEIEVIQPDYINQAYERVLAIDVRYRFVIGPSSLRAYTPLRYALLVADGGLVDRVQGPAGRREAGRHSLDVLRSGVMVRDTLDEVLDLVFVDLMSRRRFGLLVRDFAHHLFDLVFG